MKTKLRPAVHQEFLWALGKRMPDGTTAIMYRLGTSGRDVYNAVVSENTYGSGWTGKGLAIDGWKPVRILVTADFQ